MLKEVAKSNMCTCLISWLEISIYYAHVCEGDLLLAGDVI